eukprot:2386270-Pleurochrysis_carterae.AAC.1
MHVREASLSKACREMFVLLEPQANPRSYERSRSSSAMNRFFGTACCSAQLLLERLSKERPSPCSPQRCRLGKPRRASSYRQVRVRLWWEALASPVLDRSEVARARRAVVRRGSAGCDMPLDVASR